MTPIRPTGAREPRSSGVVRTEIAIWAAEFRARKAAKLVGRYQETNRQADIDEAISALREAAAWVPQNHLNGAVALRAVRAVENLGSWLVDRHG